MLKTTVSSATGTVVGSDGVCYFTSCSRNPGTAHSARRGEKRRVAVTLAPLRMVFHVAQGQLSLRKETTGGHPAVTSLQGVRA